MSHDILPQYAVAQKIGDALRSAGNVQAAWLEGSLGRGADADRYSDIDLHVLASPENKADFVAGFEALLQGVKSILFYRPLPYDPLVASVVFDDLSSLDLWLVTKSEPLEEGRAQILFDPEHRLQLVPPQPPDLSEVRKLLELRLQDFWSGIAALRKLGRASQEHIVAIHDLSHKVEYFCDVMMLGQGKLRNVGMGRINLYLEPQIKRELESLLALPEVSPDTLARAFLKLTDMMQIHGRRAAERQGVTYPEHLEATVLSKVRQELSDLGIATEVQP